MKAVILAAGIGSRLGNLFPNTPKCLITLGEKTILEQNLETLKEIGIKEEDITIVVGGKGDVWNSVNQEKIKKMHKNVIINNENIEKNQAYSFWLGAKDINDNLVCIDGDTLFDKIVLKKLIEYEYPSCFITKKGSPAEIFRRVVIDNDRVLGIGKELQSERRYMPILKFGTDFLFALKKELNSKPEIYFNNSIEIAISKICSVYPIYNLNLENIGAEIDNLVVNINTPEEYYSAERNLRLRGKKNFVALMFGYTAVGKSTTAKKIASIQETLIYHSSVTRKNLGLTPKTVEEADKVFDFTNNLREDMDTQVYTKLAESAEAALGDGKNVILDAGYFFNWQRELVYNKVLKFNPEVFLIKVTCSDEEEIKRRLDERAKKFGTDPTAETPSWNTYLATKKITEPVELDSYKKLNVIEYDTLFNKIRIINSNWGIHTQNIISTLEKNIP